MRCKHFAHHDGKEKKLWKQVARNDIVHQNGAPRGIMLQPTTAKILTNPPPANLKKRIGSWLEAVQNIGLRTIHIYVYYTCCAPRSSWRTVPSSTRSVFTHTTKHKNTFPKKDTRLCRKECPPVRQIKTKSCFKKHPDTFITRLDRGYIGQKDRPSSATATATLRCLKMFEHCTLAQLYYSMLLDDLQ